MLIPLRFIRTSKSERWPGKAMSYYGPAYANIQSGWYRETADPNYAVDRQKIDAVWNFQCDEIIRSYMERYGTFFTAFDEGMLHDVERAAEADLKDVVRYYCYYFATRAWEMEDTRLQWIASHRQAEARSYTCTTCQSQFRLIDAHPDLIRRHGVDLRVCRTCDYVLRRYDALGSSVVSRVPSLMRSLTENRICQLCDRSFDLENSVFTYAWGGSNSIDLLYPNLFVAICPSCFKRAFRDCRRGSQQTHLRRLYELFLFTKKVPTQDFGSLLYGCRDRSSVLKLIELLRKTRTPHGYTEEFGSFFAALVESGVLPEGGKRMVIGTMVLAKDGHPCYSLPEKDIDDYLFEHGVAHQKEVSYPGRDFRCDWEVTVRSDQRVFIEYFGLMGNADYAQRAREKIALAEEVGIELIALYPENDWRWTLADRIGPTSRSS